jgi:hypothetical protein
METEGESSATLVETLLSSTLFAFYVSSATRVVANRQEIDSFACALTADSELNEISEEKWTAKGDVKSLVQSYSTFAPVYQKLLG